MLLIEQITRKAIKDYREKKDFDDFLNILPTKDRYAQLVMQEYAEKMKELISKEGFEPVSEEYKRKVTNRLLRMV